MFPNRARQYTPKQQAFLEAIRDPDNCGNLKLCAKIAGYDGRSETVAAIIKTLKDEIIDIAKEIMASCSVEASLVIAGAMREADPMTGIKTQNAERILDRVGLVKGERIIVDNAPNRIAILPARRSS